MANYANITEYLSRPGQEDWTASFSEVEAILGFSLPASARRHKAWWANNWHSQSHGWMSAGFRATAVDLENEFVTFRKSAIASRSVPTPRLALAKKVAAELLGVRPSQVELCVRA
jgi:hypothetical protein